eukprot:gene2589-1608_t
MINNTFDLLTLILIIIIINTNKHRSLRFISCKVKRRKDYSKYQQQQQQQIKHYQHAHAPTFFFPIICASVFSFHIIKNVKVPELKNMSYMNTTFFSFSVSVTTYKVVIPYNSRIPYYRIHPIRKGRRGTQNISNNNNNNKNNNKNYNILGLYRVHSVYIFGTGI